MINKIKNNYLDKLNYNKINEQLDLMFLKI